MFLYELLIHEWISKSHDSYENANRSDFLIFKYNFLSERYTILPFGRGVPAGPLL